MSKENIIKFPSNVHNLDVYRTKKKKTPGEEFGESMDKLFSMTPQEADAYIKKKEEENGRPKT